MKDFHYKRTKNNFRLIAFSEIACMALLEIVEVMKYEESIKEMEISDSNNFIALSLELSPLDNNLNDLLIREFLSKFRELLKKKS